MFYPLLHLYQNRSLSLQYHLRRILAAVKLQQLLENGIFVFHYVMHSDWSIDYSGVGDNIIYVGDLMMVTLMVTSCVTKRAGAGSATAQPRVNSGK